MRPVLRYILLTSLGLLGAGVFLLGIDWGLPSARVNSFLFGNREGWSGQEILDQSPVSRDPNLGSDVDRNPILLRDTPVILNGSDAQRAEIVRRYRLFSDQPDEMITLMALARMHPSHGDFDPRLYQYGGLWIYGVGAALRVADMAGWVDLRPDPAFYLDHPDQFARFYVVARLYGVLWGLIGIWAVYQLTRLFTAHRWAPFVAVLCYLFMPVVLSAAHEAKPHLAGTVLMLLTVLCAAHFVQKGKARWCIAAGVLAGLSIGMVLSSLGVLVVIPLMGFLRRQDPVRRRIQATLAAGLLCVLCYAMTNPYVVINLFVNRSLLGSNLANTQAMYSVSLGGVWRSVLFIAEGMSPALAIYGAFGALMLMIHGRMRRTSGQPDPDPSTAKAGGPIHWLVIAPALVITLQFMLSASGKPAEFARFFLFLDIILGITAVVSIDRLTHSPLMRVLSYAFVTTTVILFGLLYERAFVRDASSVSARMQWADQLERMGRNGAKIIGVFAEPAPYSLPPVDLWHWELVLLPANGNWGTLRPDLIISPADTLDDAHPPIRGYVMLPDMYIRQPIVPKITWADKPFAVWVKEPDYSAAQPTTATSTADPLVDRTAPDPATRKD